ncbi:NADPH:quinone reductase-like Zn-dependent oxidoreductase [Paenibacillus castaneae]|uniref:zinc-binding dehydrogenase n=1 Tax=Paenibacillus castaneae TaxID=474957 RepID=UPI000C9B833B|nr:zinc-binding dehydrogenase [Paenibacillus castaneae]NIK76743.1 NADPH:quinone reductase-like Zn-dependent oxidoreductase [Paenibacillus castaneae]
MKAIVTHNPGKPDSLVMADIAKPEPGPGEISVRVQAAGLNPVDYKLMLNGNPAWHYPHIPGIDAAGYVDAVGAGVEQWKAGDRVVFHGDLAKQGVFAQYAVTTAHTAAEIPVSLSFTDAAAFPCAGLTAYQALIRKMNLKAGQTIFIHGGAGGVGGYAIQIAKNKGAALILTSASAQNSDYLKSLGADEVIDYNSEDVHERIMDLTEGRGVDLILNTINRKTAQADLSALSFGGQLACIAGAPEVVADFQPSFKTFSVHKLMLGGAHGSGNREAELDLAIMAKEFMQLMVEGHIVSLVSETITLDQVPAALTRLSERHVRGKIVVEL